MQWGTPREIYTSPANDYVADFVAHMNPLGVLCAADVMQPGEAALSQAVSPDASLEDVMAALEAEGGCNVVRDGMTVGQIQSGAVLRRLLNPRG